MKNINLEKKEKIIDFIKNGFSLIEVLATLAILSLGISTITALVVTNMKSSDLAKNQIIAMGLAQEGIELVRNFKDGQPSFNSTTPGRANGFDYRVDTQSTFAEFVDNSSSDKQLYLRDPGTFYTHASGGNQPTKFYRKIVIVNIPAEKKILVKSIVSWNPDTSLGFLADNDLTKCTLGNKCLSLESSMFDVE